jgi:hypothetical protein
MFEKEQNYILDLSNEPKTMKTFLDVLNNPRDIRYNIHQLTTIIPYIKKYDAYNIISTLMNSLMIDYKQDKYSSDWIQFRRHIVISDDIKLEQEILENMESDFILSFENLSNDRLGIIKDYLNILKNIKKCKFISFDMRVFPVDIYNLLIENNHVKYLHFKNIKSNNIYISKLSEKNRFKIITKESLLENYIINNDTNHNYEIFHINDDILELIGFIFYTSYISNKFNKILDILFNRKDYEELTDRIYLYAIKNNYNDLFMYTYNRTRLLPKSSYENTNIIINYGSLTIIYWLINHNYNFFPKVVDICLIYRKYESIPFFILDDYEFKKSDIVNTIIVECPELLKLVITCGGLFNDDSFYLIWTYTSDLDLMRFSLENKCPIKKFLELKKSEHIKNYITEKFGDILEKN